MRKLLLIATALAALVGTPALAADMAAPVYKAPPPTAPVWSWTGFYVGLNGGYGWNQATGNTTCIDPTGVVGGFGCNLPNSGITKAQGGLFGAQAGYNWQASSFVWGLETDIQWSGIKGSGAKTDFCCTAPFPAAGVDTASTNLQWFGTFRGRVGVLASPSALLYVTGGLIYGHESVANAVTFPAVQYPATAATTRAGGTVGGGLEYAFTPNFSGKIEGLWYDLGSLNDSFTSPITGYTEQFHYRFRGEIVRGGLNWKFSSQ